jgi:hypothetical protein
MNRLAILCVLGMVCGGCDNHSQLSDRVSAIEQYLRPAPLYPRGESSCRPLASILQVPAGNNCKRVTQDQYDYWFDSVLRNARGAFNGPTAELLRSGVEQLRERIRELEKEVIRLKKNVACPPAPDNNKNCRILGYDPSYDE